LEYPFPLPFDHSVALHFSERGKPLGMNPQGIKKSKASCKIQVISYLRPLLPERHPEGRPPSHGRCGGMAEAPPAPPGVLGCYVPYYG